LVGRIQELYDTAPWVVQLFGIVIERDFSFSGGGRDFHLGGLQFGYRLFDSLSHAATDHLQILRIAGSAAFAVRESIRVRCAVGMSGANEYVTRRKLLDRRP